MILFNPNLGNQKVHAFTKVISSKVIVIARWSSRLLFKYTFSLLGFYGISTIVGYLMPNPPYTLYNIFSRNQCSFFFLFFMHTVK